MEQMSRRGFVGGAGAVLAGVTVAGATGTSRALADEASAQVNAIVDASQVIWDKEADFVVVGSGTAIYGALGATEAGASAIVVEQRGILGGTTRLSGCCVWVPGNGHQVEEGYGEDLSSDEILAYLREIDVVGGGSDETRADYVANAATFFAWAEESWGLKQTVYTVLGDYHDNEGCKAMGRSLIHVDDAGQVLTMNDYFEQKIEPLVEERDIEVLLDTRATALVRDEEGAVVGVLASGEDGELAIRARKGVLLGAGGFEHDPALRARYLRGPVFGSNSVETNTGDAIVMGMKAGAAVANMGSVWQLPFYLTGEEEDLSVTTDWFEYGGLPGSLTVNAKGRRFCNENTAYGAADLAFYAYDTHTFQYENLPAWQIWDADHVANYGWPAYASEQPSWVQAFDSLDELAEACGVDKDGLADEVARFNAFAESGVDEDWHRGEGNYGPIDVAGYGVERPELANPCMAPVATPPFYAAQVVPGCCGGTCGGLEVDVDSRVLDWGGEPIVGLYACGNTSASPFGNAYPGAGATDGIGFYRAFRAANHACGLGVF